MGQLRQHVDRTVTWINHAFRDRQILIRSDGDVTYLPLSRVHQMIAAGTALGILLWGLIFTAGFGMSVSRIADQSTQIYDLEIGYADLITQIAEEQEAPRAVAGNMNDRDFIADRVVDRNRELQARIARLERDLEASQTVRDEAVAQAEASTGALAAVEAEVASLSSELGTVRGTLDQIRSERDSLAVLRDGLSDEQNSLLAEIERLRLAETRALAYSTELEEQIGDLTASVQDAFDTVDTLIAERDQLTAALDAKQDELAAAHDHLAETQDLMRRSYVNAMWRSMENDALRDRLGEMEGRSGALQLEIARLERAQESLVATLREESERHVLDVEEGLAFTGLDIVDMIDRLRSQGDGNGGQGGPMLPVLPPEVRDTPIEGQAEVLMELFTRASELRALANRMPIAMPMVSGYTLTSGFGARRDPFTGRVSGHEGLDFGAERRTPIYAPAAGVVTHAGRRGAYGNTVEIDHGLGLTTRYAHMHFISVEEGDIVAHGDRLGGVGNTGRSTGPHLHYEVRMNGRAVDPMSFIKAASNVQ
jgi:murein DD-endopeptidase MepM/ murein hydrolase activator NlpD